MSKKKLEEFMSNPPVTDPRYIENATLVDLKQTPQHMKVDVIEQLNSAITGSKMKLLNLFIAKRMRLLIEVIEEF